MLHDALWRRQRTGPLMAASAEAASAKSMKAKEGLSRGTLNCTAGRLPPVARGPISENACAAQGSGMRV